MVKAKVVNWLQEKLETQHASDETSDMNGSEHSDKLFDFLYKTSNNTCPDCAIKIFEILSIKCLKRKLVHLLSNFQNDALKNLYF